MARSEISNDRDDYIDTKIMNRKTTGQINSSNAQNNKSTKEYMAMPNVKAFNNKMKERMLTGGRPYAFDSVENLNRDIVAFIDICEETNTVPTITGVSYWIGCDRDTIYNHANNPNSPFSATCKNIIRMCHMTMENGTIAGKINPVTFIFLAKNYFDLKDDKNITVTPVTNDSINSQATMDAIQQQIAQENTPNAEYVEK